MLRGGALRPRDALAQASPLRGDPHGLETPEGGPCRRGACGHPMGFVLAEWQGGPGSSIPAWPAFSCGWTLAEVALLVTVLASRSASQGRLAEQNRSAAPCARLSCVISLICAVSGADPATVLNRINLNNCFHGEMCYFEILFMDQSLSAGKLLLMPMAGTRDKACRRSL